MKADLEATAEDIFQSLKYSSLKYRVAIAAATRQTRPEGATLSEDEMTSMLKALAKAVSSGSVRTIDLTQTL